MLRCNVLPIFDGIVDYCEALNTHFAGHVCRTTHSRHHKSQFSRPLHSSILPTHDSFSHLIHLQVPLDKFFIIILLCCDIMCLNFLFLVRNTGSWLEIGTSISHFVIMEVTVVVLCLLQLIAKVLTTGQLQSLLMSGRSRDLSSNTPKIE